MSTISIFDCDGVLVDSVRTLFSMNQEAVASCGKLLTVDEYTSCFEGSINEGLIVLLGLTEKEQQQVNSSKSTLFSTYYTPQKAHLFPFAKELILQAHQLGEVWIVSTSPSELIKDILDTEGLRSYFTHIIGQKEKSKSLVFQEMLSNRSGDTVFFITDTTGDLKEAKKSNMPMFLIGVSWGFHKESLLRQEHPDVVVSDSREIISYMRSHIV